MINRPWFRIQHIRWALVSVLGVLGCAEAPSPSPTALTPEAVLASDDSVFSHDGWSLDTLTPTPFGPYDRIGVASWISYADGTVWLTDGSGDPFLHLIAAGSGAYLRSAGRMGDGPGDFSSAWHAAIRPGHPSEGWVLDVGLQRLTAVFRDPETPPRVIRQAVLGLTEIAWLDSTRLLVLTRRDTAHLSVVDTVGQVLQMSPGVLLGPDSVPRPLRVQQSALAKVCVRPDGDRFALAYRRAGRLAIHDATLRLIRTAEVPFPSEGQFGVSKRMGEWGERSRRLFYIACTASQDHLYALFSGRLQDSTTTPIYGTGKTSGTFVHVFNWEGALERIFYLTHEVISIVQVGDSVLYGSNPMTDTLFTFRIPPAQGGVR